MDSVKLYTHFGGGDGAYVLSQGASGNPPHSRVAFAGIIEPVIHYGLRSLSIPTHRKKGEKWVIRQTA
jgi:hypothetical protein